MSTADCREKSRSENDEFARVIRELYCFIGLSFHINYREQDTRNGLRLKDTKHTLTITLIGSHMSSI